MSFASSLARLCMVDDESRWGLLPALLARAARLGIGGDALNELVDSMVEHWHEWGTRLQVRTQDVRTLPTCGASHPCHMAATADTENKRAHPPA
ncbi:MAG: hypothetical protein IPH35_18295 [Rhodoferax sp.]|nr:hypothetical protein [Rhodoferax sp.]